MREIVFFGKVIHAEDHDCEWCGKQAANECRIALDRADRMESDAS